MALTPGDIKKIQDEVHKYRSTKEGKARGNPLSVFCLIEPVIVDVLQGAETLFPDAKTTIDEIIKLLGDLKTALCH